MALVHLPDGSKGLLDKSGKIVPLNFSFDQLEPFARGLAAVKVGDKYGYVDRNGNLIVAPSTTPPTSLTRVWPKWGEKINMV